MEQTPEKQKPNSSQSCVPKVCNVTGHNYKEKAKAFMQATQGDRGLFGELIDPFNEPQPWGAWKAYFGRIGKRGGVTRMSEMERRFETFNVKPNTKDRRASECYLVPASMPSDFDEDREWFSDRQAGDVFIAEKQKQKSARGITESAEHRAAVVHKVLGYNPDPSKQGPKPTKLDSNWSTVI